jgi:serine/threonine protein kinase
MAQKYGQWKVIRSLDEGGQAHILLVEHETSKKLAVLKRLKNQNRIERFRSELKVMQENPEKNFFPEVYDADLECERPFVVMEYFENGSLTAEMVQHWSIEEKVTFYDHLMVAVGFANNAGVIHRDLKPENILVTNNKRPRVTDFGICYFDDDGIRQTRVDEAVGSFRFMAPEMEDGKSDQIGEHTDVYSLGKIGYWLFAGKIYNREKHREASFDLSKSGSEAWRHFFNDFLDRATNAEPVVRLQNTAELIVEFEKVRKAIMKDARYLDTNVEQKCMFCNTGHYDVMHNSVDGNNVVGIADFGFNPVGNPRSLVLVCVQCGNLQVFRRDLCNGWAWKN